MECKPDERCVAFTTITWIVQNALSLILLLYQDTQFSLFRKNGDMSGQDPAEAIIDEYFEYLADRDVYRYRQSTISFADLFNAV